MTQKNLMTIGRAVRISLPNFGLINIPAKIDTGADTSTIWASDIHEAKDGLHFVFFAPGSPHYSGEKIVVPATEYTQTSIASSFGQREYRYKLKVSIKVQGRLVRATFTLADRQNMIYPVLLGRRLLKGKFLVDVSQGQPLVDDERALQTKIKRMIKQKIKREAK